VSTERVLRESAIAKASQSRLEKEFSRQESEITDLSSRLRVASDRLERDSQVISAADRTRRQQEVADMERDLQQRQSVFKADLNRRRDGELSKVIEVANRAIRLIAESNDIDIIFQEAVYASDASDITDAVIAQMESSRIEPAQRGVIFSTRTVKFVSTERVLRESEPALLARSKLELEFKARELALASTGSSAREDGERQKFREDLNARRNQELAIVVEMANKEIRRIAERDSIDFVFQEAVFASSSVDLSQPIVSALNASHHHNENKSLSGTRVAEGKKDIQSRNPGGSDKSIATNGRKGAVTTQNSDSREQHPTKVELSLVSSVSNPNAAGVVVIDLTSSGDIVLLTVDGIEEVPRTEGRYSVRRFARVGENKFEVVATDRFGNTKKHHNCFRASLKRKIWNHSQ
jgi:outer membrane protein